MAVPWAAVVETHTAALFFAGEFVVKVKKPVELDFVDLTEPQQRRLACEAEVALNQRLSPDVYVGVAAIALDNRPVEHAVVMRRLPADTALSARIHAGDEGLDAAVTDLADLLSRFHERCPRVGVELSRELWTEPIELWRTETARTAALGWGPRASSELHRALCLAEHYAGERKLLFRDRVSRGLVREGHGDLLADDIYLLPDGPRVLDCLEFDQRLRVCDVLHDVAFLAMDLERLGRADLADILVSRYEAQTEPHPVTLRHFFVAHRALVRAKVQAVRGQQRQERGDAGAAELLALAIRHLEAAQPRLVLLGGLPGTGKTTVATALTQRLSAVHLSSDRIRHELVPAASDASAFEAGRYSPSATDAVYDEMLRRAVTALRAGEHVVLDASWRAATHREAAAAAAARAGALLVEIEASVDEATAARRLARRARIAGESEATGGVRQQMRDRFDPWPDATTVSTLASVDEVSAMIADIVGQAAAAAFPRADAARALAAAGGTR